MKSSLIALALVVLAARAALSQDHLIPDVGVLVDPDVYHQKIRHVFGQAFDKDVTLRVVVLPSFKNEYAVGVRIKDEAAEVFLLEPSSSIWDTELVRLSKAGHIRTFSLKGGKEIPLDDDEDFKELKRKTPADYRTIKANRKARPIPRDLADRLQKLWGDMLLGVKHPAEPINGDDGVTYHFSAWLLGRGDLSGQVWSPDEDSKTGRLTALVEELAAYVKEGASLDKLKSRLDKVAAP